MLDLSGARTTLAVFRINPLFTIWQSPVPHGNELCHRGKFDTVHKVLLVTFANNEQWVVDIAGSQFGFPEFYPYRRYLVERGAQFLHSYELYNVTSTMDLGSPPYPGLVEESLYYRHRFMEYLRYRYNVQNTTNALSSCTMPDWDAVMITIYKFHETSVKNLSNA